MSKNDITGDDLKSKASTDAYREGHDRIFGRRPCPECNGIGVVVDNVDAPVNNGENNQPSARNVQTSQAR